MEQFVEAGNANSGDHGHVGRKGQVGGSGPPNHALMVKHILEHYDRATANDKQYGENWYEAAHTFAKGLASKYDLTVKQAAGIISALSPQESWAQNMRMAEELARTGKTKGIGAFVRTAQAIRAGGDPDTLLKGPKTNAFYHDIADPKGAQMVVVDRHALNLAIGDDKDGTGRLHYDESKLNNKGHYEAFQAAYKDAAEQRNVSPTTMQAVTWSVRRSELDRTPQKDTLKIDLKEGGAGSGNFGHAGVPGKVGGSAPSDSFKEEPVKPHEIPGAEGYVGTVAPWDLKADAPPRYPGDDSIYSPAEKDSSGNYALGRRLQGTQTGKDPQNEVAMYSFIPGTATPEQLSHMEGLIKANSDHAQLHPGEIAYNDENGELVRVPGNNYWIRGDYQDLQKLDGLLTPEVTNKFGDRNAYSIMMTDKTPGGTVISQGQPTTHMRVVVPFKPDTPPDTVGEPILSDRTRTQILQIMSGPEGRRVWQHLDFNGVHIATNVTPEQFISLKAKVGSLGALEEPEEEHHNFGNSGATRFIPKGVNFEDYPVTALHEGGAGSGNFGHLGRSGVRGGSLPLLSKDHRMTVKQASSLIASDGGFSLSLHDDKIELKGYGVGGVVTPMVFPYAKGDNIEPQVARFVAANYDTLKTPGYFLGGWYDHKTGTVALDVSQDISNRDEALAQAKSRGERAIWDATNHADIYL